MARTNAPAGPMKVAGQAGAEQAMRGWCPEAHRRWAQLPADTQHLLLTHGWCPQRRQARRMDLKGKPEAEH